MKSKATKYKQSIINIWNEGAPFYHNRWAKNEIGPFSVTNYLIKSARIKSGHTVLDLACGTGLVTKKNGKIDFPWEVLLLTARN